MSERGLTEADLGSGIERAEQAMSEFGVVTGARTLCIRRVLPGPVERIWAYLTELEKRGRWLASGPMELRVGGRVELNFRNAELSPHVEPTPEKYKECEEGASVHGRITRCNPPRLLSYTWSEPAGESEVTFELTPQGEDVLLVLTHRRLGRPRDDGERRGRLAHPPRHSDRPSRGPGAASLLVDLRAPRGGIRTPAPG